jgi:hypothetical protein
MKLSANKAHKLARVSKKTLLEALESGKLSGEKNDKGHWLIESSEVLRVFPENRSGDTSSQPETPNENIPKTYDANILQVQLDAVRRELETANLERERERQQFSDQIEHLRGALDKAQETTAMLTNQNATEARNKPRGVLSRLFG